MNGPKKKICAVDFLIKVDEKDIEEVDPRASKAIQNGNFFEDKYKPLDVDDILGRTESIDFISDYIQYPESKVLIVSGTTGCGKATICNLVLHHYDFTIFYFDHNDCRSSKTFLDRVYKIFQMYNHENSANVAFMIYDFDFSFNETIYNSFIRFVKKSNTTIPVICLTSTDNLSKNFKKSIVIEHRIPEPTYEQCIAFCKDIAKKEKLKISIYSIYYLVQKTNRQIRKILQTLQMVSLSGVVSRKKINLDDIKQIMKFSSTDTFYSTIDFLQNLFSDNISFKYIFQNDMMLEQSLSLDLLYSNLLSFKDPEFHLEILNTLIFCSEIQIYMFKYRLWNLKYYSILMLFGNFLYQSKILKPKKPKKITMKKNSLNNLPNIIKKNTEKFHCLSTSRFKIKSYEYKYIMDHKLNS